MSPRNTEIPPLQDNTDDLLQEFAFEIVDLGHCSYMEQNWMNGEIQNCYNAGEHTHGGSPCTWCKAKQIAAPDEHPSTFQK